MNRWAVGVGLYLGIGGGLILGVWRAREKAHRMNKRDWAAFLIVGLFFWPVALVLS